MNIKKTILLFTIILPQMIQPSFFTLKEIVKGLGGTIGASATYIYGTNRPQTKDDIIEKKAAQVVVAETVIPGSIESVSKNSITITTATNNNFNKWVALIPALYAGSIQTMHQRARHKNMFNLVQHEFNLPIKTTDSDSKKALESIESDPAFIMTTLEIIKRSKAEKTLSKKKEQTEEFYLNNFITAKTIIYEKRQAIEILKRSIQEKDMLTGDEVRAIIASIDQKNTTKS